MSLPFHYTLILRYGTLYHGEFHHKKDRLYRQIFYTHWVQTAYIIYNKTYLAVAFSNRLCFVFMPIGIVLT